MPDINEKNINELYSKLAKRDSLTYRFVLGFDRYAREGRQYGSCQMLSMVEIHTLTLIHDNPGISVGGIAEAWGRTKGAASQNVAKLEAKGLVRRSRDENDAKIVHLFTTDEGTRLSLAHKIYDIQASLHMQEQMHRTCTMEEIETFYKVMEQIVKCFES